MSGLGIERRGLSLRGESRVCCGICADGEGELHQLLVMVEGYSHTLDDMVFLFVDSAVA